MKEAIPQKVSVAELFYDLIFVYAIRRISHIIIQVDRFDMIPFQLLGEFALFILIFWSIWTYQTVYNNHFFQPHFPFYIFLFMNMFFVAVLSQSIDTNLEKSFFTFAGGTMLLFASIGIQFFLQYLKSSNEAIRKLCKYICMSLLPAVLLGVISLFFPTPLNYVVYLVAVLFAAFTPLAYGQVLTAVPTKFSHLSERYSLFMILLFGESIISMTQTIDPHHITLESFFFFLIIVLLFSFYMVMYTSGINHHLNTNGLTMMHTHLFLFWSVGIMSALLDLYIHTPLDPLFFFSLFFFSLLAFILSVLSNLKAYHKARIVYTKKTSRINVGIIIIGGFVSFLVRKDTLIMLFVITVMLLYALYDLYVHVIMRGKKHY